MGQSGMIADKHKRLSIESLRGAWSGEDCIVVAGGPSAMNAQLWTHDVWTIACNRSVRLVQPDFAVCVEPSEDQDCWEIVRASGATFFLSHAYRRHPREVWIPDKQDVRKWLFPGEEFTGGHCRLGHSTFYAIAAAACLGFETIGVIGLDLTDDRYDHRQLRDAEAGYRRLQDLLKPKHRILNLNPESRLTAFKAGSWKDLRTKMH